MKMSDNVKELLETRGITQEDVATVVGAAEESGKKLVHKENGHFLAKERLGGFTVYVEYTMDGAEAQVLDAYSHRVNLAEELA